MSLTFANHIAICATFQATQRFVGADLPPDLDHHLASWAFAAAARPRSPKPTLMPEPKPEAGAERLAEVSEHTRLARLPQVSGDGGDDGAAAIGNGGWSACSGREFASHKRCRRRLRARASVRAC